MVGPTPGALDVMRKSRGVKLVAKRGNKLASIGLSVEAGLAAAGVGIGDAIGCSGTDFLDVGSTEEAAWDGDVGDGKGVRMVTPSTDKPPTGFVLSMDRLFGN